MDALTAPERETMVNACDADDFITVWSAQRRIITRLRKLACAELLEEGHYGTTVWAKFKLPVEALSFRNPTTAAARDRRRQLLAARGGFAGSNVAPVRGEPDERGAPG